MTHRARLVLRFDDESTARAVHDAIEVDNEGYVESRVDGATLHAEAAAARVPALLRSVDDLLAAIATAEDVAGGPG